MVLYVLFFQDAFAADDYKKNNQAYIIPIERVAGQRNEILSSERKKHESGDVVDDYAVQVSERHISSLRSNISDTTRARRLIGEPIDQWWGCPKGSPCVYYTHDKSSQKAIERVVRAGTSEQYGPFTELKYDRDTGADFETVNLENYETIGSVSAKDGYTALEDVIESLDKKHEHEFLVIVGGESDKYRISFYYNKKAGRLNFWIPDAGTLNLQYRSHSARSGTMRKQQAESSFRREYYSSGLYSKVNYLLPMLQKYEVMVATPLSGGARTLAPNVSLAAAGAAGVAGVAGKPKRNFFSSKKSKAQTTKQRNKETDRGANKSSGKRNEATQPAEGGITPVGPDWGSSDYQEAYVKDWERLMPLLSSDGYQGFIPLVNSEGVINIVNAFQSELPSDVGYYSLLGALNKSLNDVRVRVDTRPKASNPHGLESAPKHLIDRKMFDEVKRLHATAIRYSLFGYKELTHVLEEFEKNPEDGISAAFKQVRLYRQWHRDRSLIIKVATPKQQIVILLKDKPYLQALITLPGQVIYTHNNLKHDDSVADGGNELFFDRLLKVLETYLGDYDSASLKLSLAVSDDYGDKLMMPVRSQVDPKSMEAVEKIEKKTGYISAVFPVDPDSVNEYKSHVLKMCSLLEEVAGNKIEELEELEGSYLDLEDSEPESDVIDAERMVYVKKMVELDVRKAHMDRAIKRINKMSDLFGALEQSLDGGTRVERFIASIPDEERDSFQSFLTAPAKEEFQDDLWERAMNSVELPDTSAAVSPYYNDYKKLKDKMDDKVRQEEAASRQTSGVNSATNTLSRLSITDGAQTLQRTPNRFDRIILDRRSQSSPAAHETVGKVSVIHSVLLEMIGIYNKEYEASDLKILGMLLEASLDDMKSYVNPAESYRDAGDYYAELDRFLLNEAKKTNFTGPSFTALERYRIQLEASMKIRYPVKLKEDEGGDSSYDFERNFSSWVGKVKQENAARHSAMSRYYESLTAKLVHTKSVKNTAESKTEDSHSSAEDTSGSLNEGFGSDAEEETGSWDRSKHLRHHKALTEGFILTGLKKGRWLFDATVSSVEWNAIGGARYVADKTLDEIRNGIRQVVSKGIQKFIDDDEIEKTPASLFCDAFQEDLVPFFSEKAIPHYPGVERLWLVDLLSQLLKKIDSNSAAGLASMSGLMRASHLVQVAFVEGLDDSAGTVQTQRELINIWAHFAKQKKIELSPSVLKAFDEQAKLLSLHHKVFSLDHFKRLVAIRNWEGVQDYILQTKNGSGSAGDAESLIDRLVSNVGDLVQGKTIALDEPLQEIEVKREPEELAVVRSVDTEPESPVFERREESVHEMETEPQPQPQPQPPVSEGEEDTHSEEQMDTGLVLESDMESDKESPEDMDHEEHSPDISSGVRKRTYAPGGDGESAGKADTDNDNSDSDCSSVCSQDSVQAAKARCKCAIL